MLLDVFDEALSPVFFAFFEFTPADVGNQLVIKVFIAEFDLMSVK